MERSAKAFCAKFTTLYPKRNSPILIFCGTGNNGGDGLAIGRLLAQEEYHVKIFTIESTAKASVDFRENLKRLPTSVLNTHISSQTDFPLLSDHEIIIDALFGSGLNRSIEGLASDLIQHVNAAGASIVSVDIASGLFADKHTPSAAIIQPDHTISFQLPKLAFLLPENDLYVGEWCVVDIELSKTFIDQQTTAHYLLQKEDVAALIPDRKKFGHKGDYGRLLLVAGSKGKMGAAILAARAALRSGVGLLYVRAPEIGRDVMQVAVPEAMVVEEADVDWEQMNASAVGPGIGTDDQTAESLYQLLNQWKKPMVLDADAINMLVIHPKLFNVLPKQSILTPHPGEFRRLVGEWTDDFHRLELLQALCQKHKVNVVLKGAHSAICDSNGTIYFNSTGNPGMATGGSGDVLTGIIGALLAQGLSPLDALKLGVYVHGLAGDVAAAKIGVLSLTAGDVIDELPESYIILSKN
jgi:NAD(P)H-hydrate epimerase